MEAEEKESVDNFEEEIKKLKLKESRRESKV